MIGYRISRKKLRETIEESVPGWLQKAAERTEQFRAAGGYEETSSIWSKVKPVYMRLQGGSKCAFCERKLEAEEYGKGEQAVEHFRPKGNVKAWKASDALRKEAVVTKPPAGEGGYYLLPYDLFNYSASCIPCNSALKRDYFPIAGKYRLHGELPEDPLDEEPLLLYPIGDFDDDPEKLIRFHGTSPYAAARPGYKRARALVTIEFFELDNTARTNLIRERAAVIVALSAALTVLAGKPGGRVAAAANNIVDGLTQPNSAHCNCARCFRGLFESDPESAQEVYEKAADLIASKS